MDGSRFDAIARKLADRRSRREVVMAGGAALGAGIVAAVPLSADAAAKRPDGSGCSKNADCASAWCAPRDATGRRTCQSATCLNEGWKFGDADWSCPSGYRMPTVDEWSLVAPCVTSADQAQFSYNNDVAVSVGGCNCKWNSDWCYQPSIETIRQGRACGDYRQLQICVAA